jgi:uncharacterized protein (DUF1697 family)
MRMVALLRNVNHGQRGHPFTEDVLGAFRDAGCADPVCFQSNGTVIFDADPVTEIIADVMLSLAARSGVERDGLRYHFRIWRASCAFTQTRQTCRAAS